MIETNRAGGGAGSGVTLRSGTGFGLGVLLQQYGYKLGYRIMPNISFSGRELAPLAGSSGTRRIVESTWLTLPVSGMFRTNPVRGWWLYFPAGLQYSHDLAAGPGLNSFGAHGGMGFTKILQYFELGVELRGQYVLAETVVPGWKLDKRSFCFSLIFAG